jgi:hypothetical protein
MAFEQKLTTNYNDIIENYVEDVGYQRPGEPTVEIALVMDGPSFKYFKENDLVQRQQLLKIGACCRSVVSCRLTPVQKQQVLQKLLFLSFSLLLSPNNTRIYLYIAGEIGENRY